MRVLVDEAGPTTYPDLACEPEFEDEHEDTLLNPILIVEVLSSSTEGYDRGPKFELYETIPTVQEVLFVRQTRRHVERSKRVGPKPWLRESFTAGDIPLDTLGFSVPIDEIYERVRLVPKPPLR